MRIVDCIQGSPEWYEARLGRITSSRVADMMARTKAGWGAEHYRYEAELIVERQTSQRKVGFKSAAMQWGTDTQPQAQSAYEVRTDNEVTTVGFVVHDVYLFGASPDGLIREDGLAEFKCPETHTHIETLLEEKIPGKYQWQMQWQMYLTKRRWCDYVSFDPRMKPAKRLFVKRVWRDETKISELERTALDLLASVERKLIALERKYPDAIGVAA